MVLGTGHRPGSLRTHSTVWTKQGCRSSRVTEHWRAFRTWVSHCERLTYNEASHICMSFIIIQIVSSSRGVVLPPRWIWACSTQAFTWLFPQPVSISAKAECSHSLFIWFSSFTECYFSYIIFSHLIAVKATEVTIWRCEICDQTWHISMHEEPED